MIETIVASVVLPAVLDLFKSGAQAIRTKWIGLSIEDQIKLDNATVEKTKALAALDTPIGSPSQWVVDLRASFRYIAAGVSILTGAAIVFYGPDPEVKAAGLELIGVPFGFIFGERLWFGLTGRQK